MKDIQLIQNENIELRLKLKDKCKENKMYIELLDLKETLDTYLLAHKNCRDRFNYIDKVCNISTLLLTCTTSYLVSSGDTTESNLDMYVAFASAFTSGITNYINAATKAGDHSGIILMYTELINKIIKTLNCPEDESKIGEKCKEYYTNYIELNTQTAKIGLLAHIRRKYNII